MQQISLENRHQNYCRSPLLGERETHYTEKLTMKLKNLYNQNQGLESQSHTEHVNLFLGCHKKTYQYNLVSGVPS